MLTNLFLSIFTLAFQAVVLFFLLYLPLSLWDIHPAYPGGITLIFMAVLVFLHARIYDLFFLSMPGGDEKEKEEIEKASAEISTRLKKLGANCPVTVFPEYHPVILSYSDLWGKKRLVISKGLLDILTVDEAVILAYREAELLKRGDTGIFSAAAFLPFLIFAFSSWLIESARETRVHRGTGASYLAGAILFYAYRAMEFFLLIISRRRQRDGYGIIKSCNSAIPFLTALEKTASAFSLPVKEGPLFRKQIYLGLKYFFPFDPFQFRNLLIWKYYLSTGSGMFQLERELGEKNPFVKANDIFTSHPPAWKVFPDLPEAAEKEESSSTSPVPSFKDMKDAIKENLGKESPEDPAEAGKGDGITLKNRSADTPAVEFPFSAGELRRNIFMDMLPLYFFLLGVVVIILAHGMFGSPLIGLGAGLAAQLIYRITREKKAPRDKTRDFSPMNAGGTLREWTVEEKLDAPYYFLERLDCIMPVVLRQLIRNEEPLQKIILKEIQVEGTARFEEIPYIEAKKITWDDKKSGIIRSWNFAFRGLTAFGSLLIGGLMIMIELYHLI